VKPDIPPEWIDRAIVIPLTFGRARIVVPDAWDGCTYEWPFW
jgi:hypothetical protein